MKKRTRCTLKTLVLSCLVTFCCIGNVRAADDAIMNMLPEDCAVCVRINNFSGSLGKLDMYLAGVSPMPLAMLVNMQLAGAIGDPMMTGLDMTGDVVFFMMPSAKGSTEPPMMGLMVPVTDYDTFVKGNPHCTQGADNVTTLAPPQSPMGSFVMMAANDNKHALVVPATSKPALLKAQAAITNKTGKKLAARLNTAQTKQAAEAPMFVYVNIAALYDRFSQDILEAFATFPQVPPSTTGGPEAMGMKMFGEMFKGFGGDADSLTLTLNPEATTLNINAGLRAKDGSDLAKMLVADPQAPKSFKMGGYLDKDSAVNALIKMNRPLFTRINEKFMAIMDTAFDSPELKEQSAKMKTFMKTVMNGMGDEISVSFSYAAGMPPVVLKKVIDVKEKDFFKTTAVDGIAYANAMYKAMEMPMTLSYKEKTAMHKYVRIDTINLKMDMPADMTPEMQAQMAMMGGMDFTYHVAQSGNKAMVAAGLGSEEAIKAMIDGPSSTVPADFQAAMDTFEKTPYSDYICSVNVIRLMTGLGEMMGSMGAQPGMPPMANIFGSLNVETQSSMAIGGQIADGQATIAMSLPKQHLLEIAQAGQQIAAQVMAAQMQMQPQPESQTDSGTSSQDQ